MPNPTVGDVVALLERSFPPELAEDWDTGIGLSCGDPADPVTTVLVAVDADEVTAREAILAGAQLLVTHHPLLFRPVQSVAAGPGAPGVVHLLQRAGVAHFSAHTNADKAIGGVNDALAELLELADLRPLVPDDQSDDQPDDQPDDAGESAGQGAARTGSGRIGRLAQPLPLAELGAVVAARLPPTVTGVRVRGEASRLVRTVAVCGGSGGSYLAAAQNAGADAYLTSDLGHHFAADLPTGADAMAVLDVAHWAGEWPVLARIAAIIRSGLGGSVSTIISTQPTEPWTFRVASPSRPLEKGRPVAQG